MPGLVFFGFGLHQMFRLMLEFAFFLVLDVSSDDLWGESEDSCFV